MFWGKSLIRVVGLFAVIATASSFAQNVEAASIEKIEILNLSLKFNAGTGQLTINGTVANSAFITFDDASVETLALPAFEMNTGSLNATIAADGQSIVYDDSTGSGFVALWNGPGFARVLQLGGTLNAFKMGITEIPNPFGTIRIFDGSGEFDVVAGSRKDPFGDKGGLATVAIEFDKPADFKNSFSADAKVTLYPLEQVDITGVPLPAAAWSGLIMLGVLGVVAKTKMKMQSV